MTGGTVEHEIIGNNVRTSLQNRLAGQRCRVFGPTMKIEVAGRIRYPDAFVFRGPVPPGSTVLRDPVVVFEVLSPNTSHTDRLDKFNEYRATPSIRRYVLLEQDALAAMVFVRRGQDFVAETAGADDVLAIPEIGVEIGLAEFYVGLDLTKAGDGAIDTT
ncbi:MAG: Uma2 family endonuclease [Proteobacteria bacterium]|nr:Uma2 family endonuclease [Pseudomonadota bacterium]